MERWKLASTKICKFCNNVEDIFHAFAQCKVVNDLLTKLFSHIDPNNIFLHEITIEDFIFGSPNVEVALNQIFRRVLSDKKYKNEQSFYIKWNCFDNLVEESIRYGEQWCLQL